MLDINPGLIIWTTVTFILLVFVLGKVAWKPLLQALQDREHLIADALKKAEDARRESERLLEENTHKLREANEQTSRILKEGRELAEQMKNDIVAKAHEHAKAEMDRAKEEIQREKESALLEMKGEITEMAIAAAEKILDETLDAPKQKKMIDKVLQQLPNN
ncbi:MAG TPA: F0F1 ATP synthase subunit B [Bacteroidota bacterium]|nr:F0F1 ATP synthase subunit B [Bacteroidota bacterium]